MQPPPSTIPGLPLGLPTKPTFPSTLPKVELTEDERRAPYGLTKKLTPAALKSDLSAYEYFCKLHVNGDRGPEYVHAVQSTTITKTLDVIRGYLGYVARQFSVPAKRLRLLQYGDPTRLAFFFAFCLVSNCATARFAVAAQPSTCLSCACLLQSSLAIYSPALIPSLP